jgi:hypothetical protein
MPPARDRLDAVANAIGEVLDERSARQFRESVGAHGEDLVGLRTDPSRQARRGVETVQLDGRGRHVVAVDEQRSLEAEDFHPRTTGGHHVECAIDDGECRVTEVEE